VRQLWKWALGLSVAIIVLVIAALIALPAVVDTPRVQALIANGASQALGRPVTFASVSVKVLPRPAVQLHQMQVAEDPTFGTVPFLKLDTGEVRLRLQPLLKGHLEFGTVVLTKPTITVIQDAAGRWNIATLGGSGEPKAAAPRQRAGGGGGSATGAGAILGSSVKIQDGVVTYMARSAGGVASNYRLEHVDLTLTGSPSLLAIKADARVKPGDLSLSLADGSVAISPGKTLLELPVRGQLTIEAKDIKDLVATAAGPSPVIGGGIKGKLALAGAVGSPRASGDVELSNLSVTEVNAQCPEPKRRTLTLPSVKLNASWEDGTLLGKPLTTGLGNGTVTGTLVASVEHGVHVELRDLAVKALPLEKILVDFLCQGYAVSGPLDLTGTTSLSPRDIWNTLSGSGQLRIGPGKVVGSRALELIGGVTRVGSAVSRLLSADVPQSLFSAPLDFDSIAGSYRITSGVVTTRDLVYTSRLMKVAVAGQYTLASGRMNLDMVVNHGRGEIQAKVTGTAASPSIQVVPASVLKNIDPGKVESGLKDLLKRFR
jgi:uncharacterized protein involved in outer membrane biogenesis